MVCKVGVGVAITLLFGEIEVTGASSGDPGVPANALTWRGQPLTWNGDVLTWR